MRQIARIVIAAAVVGVSLSQAHAGDVIKQNDVDNLNLSTSWVASGPPGSLDVGVWNNTVTGANATVLGADLSWQGIRIASPGGAVTINAGNTLTLGTAGIDMSAATQTLTLNNAVALGADQNWAVADATGDSNSDMTVGGIISGGFGITKTGAGTLSLVAANTYTGGTIINVGTVSLGGTRSGGIGVIRGVVTVNAGGTLAATVGDALGYTTGGVAVNTLNLTGGTFNNTSASNEGFITNVNLTGGTMSSTGGGKFFFSNGFGIASLTSSTTSLISSPVDISSGNNMTVNVASGTTSSGIDLSMTGIISDVGALTKSGPGRLVLGGANTYSGATLVSAGTLQLGTGGDFNKISTSSAITVSAGATLTTANLSAHNIGSLTLNGGTLASGTPNASFGSYLLQQNISIGGTAASTISGTDIVLNAANITFTVADATGDANTDLNVTGYFSDHGVAATNGLTKAGSGTMNLATASTYTGATLVNAGTLKLSVGSAIAAGSAITVGSSGTLEASVTNGVFTSPLTVSGLVTVDAGLAITTGNISLGNGGTLAGVGTGLAGFGNYTLPSGISVSYTGTTTGATISAPSVTLQGSSTSHTFNIADGSAANDLTVSGAISNASGSTSVGITKTGAGTLLLSGINTYTGATTVNAGRLLVNGSITSSVAVNVGGTLAGGGSTGAVTVNTGGTIAPGTGGVATLSITGPVVFGTGGTASAPTYAADVAPNGTSDLLALTGAGANGVLTLSNPDQLNILPLGNIGATPVVLTIATFASEVGVFDSVLVNGVASQSSDPNAANYALVTYNSNNIQLTVANVTAVPEPATAGLLFLGGIGLLARRRRAAR